jgi:uncharacterized protein
MRVRSMSSAVARAGWLLCLISSSSGCMLFNGPANNGETWPVVRNAAKEFQAETDSWWAMQRYNIVMQQYDYSCGAAALATVVRYFWGDDVTEEQFILATMQTLTPEEVQDRVANGLTMTDLRQAAVKAGYLASMGRRNLTQLSQVRVPVIVRIEKEGYEHFVVFRGIRDDRVFLADPIRGNIRLPANEFLQQWTDGTILVVAKKNTRPPTNSPLKTLPPSPVQHEVQAARRFIQKNTEASLANPLITP